MENMNEIKIGDWVRVTKGNNTNDVSWLDEHKEGEFEVLDISLGGNYELSDGDCDLFYAKEWCELITPKIDLTKPQLIKGDVKVFVWDNDMNKKDGQKRDLAVIGPDGVFWCWTASKTGQQKDYRYRDLTSWDNAELIEEPPKPKTRLMTRREILAKICTMDKDNPFLIGCFSSKKMAVESDFLKWKLPEHWGYESESSQYYYRHIHPITGEWTSEPSQFLIKVKEGEEC